MSSSTSRFRTPPAALVQAALLFIAAALPLKPALAATASTVAAASLPAVMSLKRLSLEELLAMDVTTVSRRPEPFSLAASAITVLTGDDVRRSGATTLADALRFSSGLEVARIDGRTWGIASRGFNINSSNKLLVMMDGRSLYTPLFSGVFWDVQDTVLPDIDRIEVVRGPGATMWGANAVNGVINIQTKNARDTQGTLITVGGGDEERQFASVRQGARLADGIYARVYAKEFHRDDMVTPGGVDTNDDWKMAQGGFRVDGERAGSPAAWTVQGDYYHGFLGATSRVPTRVAGGNIIGRWQHTFSPESRLLSQVYYDRVERFIPGQFREARDSVDLDSQFDAALSPRQHLVAGLVARYSKDKTGTAGTVRFDPPSRRMTSISGLVQDELIFPDNQFALTLGAKFEHNDSTGFEFQPSARAAWHPNPDHTVWAAVSRAVRTPTRFEDDLRFVISPTTTFVRGDRDFRAEELIAYELGYRIHPYRGWAADLNLFVNRYDKLRSQERANEPGVLFVLRNRLNAATAGAEVSITGQLTPIWRLRALYAYLHKRLYFDANSTDITGGVQEGDDPKHIATLVSSWDFARGWEFDALLRRISALPNPAVPAYTELDLRLGWRATTAWEFSVVGQNLLHARHREFGVETGPTARALERSVYAQATWRF